MLRRLAPILLLACCAFAMAEDRPRVIIQTDIGGDPDDQASFVRWLMYVHLWDVELIIGDNSNARPRDTGVTSLDFLAQYLDAYDQVDENLRQHHPGYPTADALRAKVVQGWDGTTARNAVMAIAADPSDPRPIWYSNWGTGKCAINQVLDLHYAAHQAAPSDPTPEQAARTFLSRFRFQTLFRLPNIDPGNAQGRWQIPMVKEEVEVAVQNGFDEEADDPYTGNWYHAFKGVVAEAADTDVADDITTGHGPLGALYTTQKEGDSWCVVGTIFGTGLDDHLHPHWGGWAGRYAPAINPNSDWGIAEHPVYTPNQNDTWQGTTDRSNTARRWAEATQSDFLCRLDWCVMTHAQANHPPVAVLGGDQTWNHLRRDVQPGQQVALSATGSSDPDSGDTLSYRWEWYPEAGSTLEQRYAGSSVAIAGADQQQCTVTIPADAQTGDTIHLILHVRDNGSRKGSRIRDLTRFRRMVFTVVANAGNQPPVITAGPTADPQIVLGDTTRLSVSASDADGDTLSTTWSVSSAPLGGEPSIGGGVAPLVTFDRAGAYTFDVVVSDGHGGSASGSIAVTVDQTASNVHIAP